jgi:hypothetical protein
MMTEEERACELEGYSVRVAEIAKGRELVELRFKGKVNLALASYLAIPNHTVWYSTEQFLSICIASLG